MRRCPLTIRLEEDELLEAVIWFRGSEHKVHLYMYTSAAPWQSAVPIAAATAASAQRPEQQRTNTAPN